MWSSSAWASHPLVFTEHLLVPGLAAAVACAVSVAVAERSALRRGYTVPERDRTPLRGAERYAIAALAAAGLTAWIAPLVGVPPMWPFAGVVALALLGERRRGRLIVPWRLTIQVAGPVVVVHALAVAALPGGSLALPALVAVGAGVGLVAAIANNLPASVWAASLLAAGPAAYAATIGLAVGALATPQGLGGHARRQRPRRRPARAAQPAAARAAGRGRRGGGLRAARGAPVSPGPRPRRGLPSSECRPSPRSSR